jgi:prolyl oligopeptidase
MKHYFSAISIISISLTSMAQHSISYPETKKGNTVDTYFGTPISDPYRWLENDKSAETASWVAAQNKVTYDYLGQIPYREELKNRLQKLWNYEKISAPFKEGKFTYYYKNNGLQNQSILYRKNEKGEESAFLDPNSFSKD